MQTKVVISIIAVSIAILGLLVFIASRGSNSATSNTVADKTLLVREDSNKKGNADAKITLVEFGDYQCPACASAYPIVSQILRDYPEDIQFIFRNFPLTSIHRNAFAGSQAAEAAGKQGKYWEMYAKLYENQTSWDNSASPLDTFKKYASEMGLNEATFESDFKSSDIDQKIKRDQKDGEDLNIQGTPTFFVNDKLIDGVPSYDQLKSLIEEQLQK